MIVNDKQKQHIMVIYSEQNKRDFLNAYKKISEGAGETLDKHRKLIYLLIIAAFVDYLSTVFFMQVEGIHKEIHPYIRYLAGLFGPITGPLIGKVLQICLGMVAVLYLRKHAEFIISFTAVMYSWAAVANFLAYIPGLVGEGGVLFE